MPNWLRRAKRLLPLSLGDENPSGTAHGSIEADFAAWATLLVPAIEKYGGW
jgi:hypothetical protein